MEPSRRHTHYRPRQRHHGRRCNRTRRVVPDAHLAPLSKPSANALAPAHETGVVEDGARVFLARSNRDGKTSAGHRHRRERVAHLRRLAAARCRGGDPQLAARVRAPALHPSVIEQCTRVAATRGDGDGRASRPEVDERKRVAHLSRCVAARIRVAKAELTRPVCTPALHATIVQQRTRVGVARRHGSRRSTRPQRHRRHPRTSLRGIVADIRGRAGAQPSVQSRAHAHHRPRGRHDAGVRVAGVDVAHCCARRQRSTRRISGCSTGDLRAHRARHRHDHRHREQYRSEPTVQCGSRDTHAADGTDASGFVASESRELHRDDTLCDDRRDTSRMRTLCRSSATRAGAA